VDYLAYIAAGAFLANGIPHFVSGISGKYFPSPFAKPPGAGESSPVVNVLWGLTNLIVAWILVAGVGDFTTGFSIDMLLFAIGFSGMALVLGWHFGRVRNKVQGDKG